MPPVHSQAQGLARKKIWVVHAKRVPVTPERYAALEGHFRAFLLKNADYDFGVALFELLKHGYATRARRPRKGPKQGRLTPLPTVRPPPRARVRARVSGRWTELFFEVAHARNVMAVALNVLVNRGALQVAHAHVRFLIKHGLFPHMVPPSHVGQCT